MSNSIEATEPPSYPVGHAPAAPYVVEQDDSDDGVNILAVAWRSRWLIVLATMLGGLGAWVYLQRVTPRYTSLATVYVEQNTPRLLAADSTWSRYSTKYLYTQAARIRSTVVLESAVNVLSESRLETFRDIDNPVAFLLEELSVQVGDQDDLIYLSIELPNRTDAAQIVNRVVDAYMEEYTRERSSDVVGVLDILSEEKRRSDAELDRRRKELDSFRTEHVNLAVQTSDENNVITKLFSALAGELNAAQIGLIEAKARYNRVEQMLSDPDKRAYLLAKSNAEQGGRRGPELDGQIQRIEQALTAERVKWGDGYPGVKLLNESLQSLREQRDTQQEAVVTSYVDGLRQDFELMVQKRDELQRAYDKQFRLASEVSTQAAQLASLEEAYHRTERYCELIDDRIREVELNKESGKLSVSIVDSAAPGEQTFPDRPKTASVGLAFGAMLGLGLAWLRDLLDQRLKSVDEIASVMQLPVIGALPVIAGLRGDEGRGQGGRLVEFHPRSPGAEAVRSLRTALHFGVAGPESKVFVVTSPAPGDGKSTVASNLAIAMAQAEQRVLLIDADMRKPTQHEIFGVETEIGLAAVLTGSQPPAEAILATETPSLDLLPCGRLPANPVELLTNGVFTEALAFLSEQYDRIIIDSPPVMPVADSRLIAALADCTVLVLRAERSTRRFSVAARDELIKVRTKRLGLVVNAAPMHRSGYGYGGYNGYGGYGVYGHSEEPSRERSKPRLKGPEKRANELTQADA